MPRSVRKATVRVVLLTGALCLWAGCDILGLGGSVLVRPTFETAGDVADRMEVLVDTTAASESWNVGAEANLLLTAVVRIQPPTVDGEGTKASHVSRDPETRRLQVGYKLAGTDFGGGIDVLGFRRENPPTELLRPQQSLRSENVDVVEVQAAPGGGALFVAGAVTTEKHGASPALLAKVTPAESGPTVRSERLSDNVAKGLVVGPAPNTVHVTTDEDAVYQFDETLEAPIELRAPDAVGLRSIAAQGAEVFALDRSGRVYAGDASNFDTLSEVAALSEADFEEGGIARLEADDDRLYAALNRDGFSIFAPSGDAVWKSESSGGVQPVYTCVTAGAKYLYAGRFDGRLEVYRRPTEVPDRRPEHVGTFRLLGGGYGQVQGAPVNHLLATDGYLFVAKGREGLIAFRVEEE